MKSFIVTTAFIFFLLTTVLAAPGIGVLGSAFDMAKEVVPIPTPILDPLTAPVTAIVGGSDKKEKESDDDDEGDDDSSEPIQIYPIQQY